MENVKCKMKKEVDKMIGEQVDLLVNWKGDKVEIMRNW